MSSDRQHRWFFLRANWHHPVQEASHVLMGACVAIDSVKAAEEEKARLFEQLNKERTRFANILEQLPSGVILAESPSGKLTYQNRAACKLLGRGVDDVASFHDYALQFHRRPWRAHPGRGIAADAYCAA